MELTKLQAAQELARRNLLDFAILTEQAYLDKPFSVNWHHEVMAKKLEAVERGEIKRLMIFLPPRHTKSVMSSVLFPAWYLGRNPKKRIITASYGQDLATDFGAKTRDLVSSEEYQGVFPVRLKEDTQSKNKWQTEDGGYYISVGVGGALTGRGADILVMDDLIKNREDAESETIRKKIWEWYTSTAYTRLEPDGAVILCMTRWHRDDIASNLLKQDGWDVLHFPAISTRVEPYRAVGEALWPERFSLEKLEEIKKTVGVYDFSALYQGNPIASENQEFKPEYFKYFKEDDIDLEQMEIITTVDVAIGKGQTNDRTAIITVGKYPSRPQWYILDIIAQRLDPIETIEAIFSVHERFRPQRIGIETVAYQKSLIYYIREEMKRRNTYLPVTELKADTKKETRIRGLQPMYKTGVILHREKSPETLMLEEELLTFPMAQHDDISDALAYHIQLRRPTTSTQIKHYGY